MLVEPLLPRAWRKELDRQKALKDDVDTDLYAVNIAEQDIAQAPEEEGSPVGDDFVVLEGPQMAKLSLKMQQISDALDLVPVSKRDCIEHAVANAIGQGLDRLMDCLQALWIQGSTTIAQNTTKVCGKQVWSSYIRSSTSQNYSNACNACSQLTPAWDK